MTNRYAAPVPEVHYLPSLFRKIQSGEIRIPAFQRGYVWKEKNILELMESIYLGYPIGSLLFWKTDPGQLREIPGEITSFPVPEPRAGEVLYVLDGMQRISTLYGAFHKIDGKNSLFRIAYDFEEERFYSPSDEGALREGSLFLDSLFNPRDLLTFQSQALSRPDGDSIVAKSIELQSIFQEYLIPTVTINERGVPDVVEIFSRVNSTGVKLDVVDFMRALTWSSQFDLTEEVASLRKQAEALKFEIEGQTFVKLIALCAGFQTTSDSMYQMSRVKPTELHAGVAAAARLVPLAIDMVVRENRIASSDLLGYEGQFLIWAAALRASNFDLSQDFRKIRELVWQIGFGELLRGKPDHFLDRILQKILTKQWSSFVGEARISGDTFMTRRFLNGKALSSTFISMFYNRLDELKQNQLIASDFPFDGRLSAAFRLDRRFGETRSNKILANLVVGLPIQNGEGVFTSCEDLYEFATSAFGASGFKDWMLANFLDPANPPINPDLFLEHRAIMMYEYAESLMGERA